MAEVFSVSCTTELRKLMKEKHISPSEALRVGVKAMLNEEFRPGEGETIIKESDNSKLQRTIRTMQNHIDELNDKLEGNDG